MTLLPRRLAIGLVLSLALAGVASAGVVDSMWTRIYKGYYCPDSNEVNQEAARVHYDSVTRSISVVGLLTCAFAASSSESDRYSRVATTSA